MPLDDLYKEAPVGGYTILPEGEYVVVVTKAIMRIFNMQTGEVQALVLKRSEERRVGKECRL